MTGLASHFGVRSRQRELRVLEGSHPPQVVAVTGPAGRAKAAFVPIVRLVTTGAILGDRRMHIAAAVAVRASNVSVATHERETRLTGVIELLRAPVGRGVAVAAVLALPSLVNVIRCVASGTRGRRAFVALTDVTGRAGSLEMLVGEVEEGVVVIEMGLLPGLRVMADGAVGSEEATVGVIPRVAAVTGRGCLAKRHAGLVTASAGEGDVRTLEREVGQVVRESGLAQPRDVGVSTEVLGMAASTLTCRDLPDVAVVTTLAPDVCRDFFVAAQAKTALPLAIGQVVALGAFGFEPGVCRGDRTRHDELFDARGPGHLAAEQRETRKNERSRVNTGVPPRRARHSRR